MSQFMELEILPKGATYSCECQFCSEIQFTHEWVNEDYNYRRDAMEKGTLHCDNCRKPVGASSFYKFRRPQYAGRYAAPGYLDSAEWNFDSNKRRLERELRNLYGE